MHLSAVGLSHVGFVREENEDEFLIVQPDKAAIGNIANVADPGLVLFAVIDGMGGIAGGRLAARTTADVIHDGVLAAAQDGLARESGEGVLRSLLGRAHAEVCRLGEEQPAVRGMGAVATIALLCEQSLLVLHAGDTRLYLWRAGRLDQVTHDHSPVGQLVHAGRITKDQARRHPLRNQVDQAIGGPDAPDPAFYTLELHPGDRLLFCSDGLTEMLPDSAIQLTMRQESRTEQAADALVEGALVHGGRDNVTVVVVDVAAGPIIG